MTAGCPVLQDDMSMSPNGTPLFGWKFEYSVGVPLIDDDHRVLVFLMEEINAIIGKSYRDRCFKLYWRDFRTYCMDHFRREDLLMAGTGYADHDSHVDEHKRLLDDLDKLHGALERTFAEPRVVADWLNYCQALLDHFEVCDKPLGEHLRLWLENNDRSEQDLENNLLRFARYWSTD